MQQYGLAMQQSLVQQSLAQQAPKAPATELAMIHERLAQLVDVTSGVARRLSVVNERAYGNGLGLNNEPRPERVGTLGTIHMLLDSLDDHLTAIMREVERVEGLV